MSDTHVPHVDVRIDSKQYVVHAKAMAVLRNLAFDVYRGEFLSVVGPSGCGKTTLLRVIAGLDRRYVGAVSINGTATCGPARDRGIVFQESRLLPWLTVKQNVAFALPSLLEPAEREERVSRVVALVGLSNFANAWPVELSGGMEKRAALARALVNVPEVLLLDEPFAALDSLARFRMQEELARVHAAELPTTILVTHEPAEAAFLSDRIVILSARPAEVKCVLEVPLERPRSRTSPEFIHFTSSLLEIILQDQ